MLSEIQKNNLNKLLAQYSFQHLRPPPQTYEIDYNQSQHFQPTSTNDRRRRIFYKVKYELEEQQAIQQTKKQLKKQGLTKYKIGDQVILKHVYGGNWDTKKITNRLKEVINYNLNQKGTDLTTQTIRKLTNGQIYTYGHDKSFRPNVIMRVDKFDLSLPIQQHFNAVYFLMLVVLGYRMVPYHAQKYNLIMDLNNISLTDIPYRYLYNALQKIGIYYCGNSQKTFVFNAEGINNIWNFVSFFLPQSQKRRIIFVPKGEESKVLAYIDEYELQKRYGGKLPNLTQYWPPKSTNEQFDVKLNETISHSEFYSVDNDEDYFHVETQKKEFCGDGNCQCSIY